MKSAMQELIDRLPQLNYADIKNFATELKNGLERQQIINARLSVTGLNHASPTDDKNLEDAEQYYTDTFTQ